jgi:prepilin-type N-terminal cleavage/methylation domain-containing protein
MRGIRDWGLGIGGKWRRLACTIARCTGNCMKEVTQRCEGAKKEKTASHFSLASLRLCVNPAPVSNPQSLIPNPSPRGMTLLEVLISMGVLLLGLLGVAALIPIGKAAMSETNKADRTGACGRAALRDVRVRRMLDSSNWASTPGSAVFIIDPLGSANLSGGTATKYFGGVAGSDTGTTKTVQRITLNNVSSVDDVFRWHDDLKFTVPENVHERPAPPSIGAYDGDFSWFVTVAPQIVLDTSNNQFTTNQSTVSIVVCWKRLFAAAANNIDAGETLVNTSCGVTTDPIVDSGGAVVGGYGGIGIQYPVAKSKVMPKENEWVLLYALNSSTTPATIRQATWYRVVSAGSDGTTTRATLVGPDWHGGLNASGNPDTAANLIVVKGVIGVYTTTVKLDDNMVW